LEKKRIMVTLLSSLFSVGFVLSSPVYAGEKLDNYALEKVLVEAKRDVLAGGLVNTKAKLGILGDKNILDIPYSEMSMTKKTLETFDNPSLPLANVLQNDPSIRTSTSSAMYTDFSMRGINMNGNHMYLNGIPSLFYQFTTPPSNVIERIDITSGPNAGINGVCMSNNGTNSGKAATPGVINIITKKATKNPITSYTQTFSSSSSWGEYLDVGRRFGKNDEWGLRINAGHLKGGLSLDGAEKNEKTLFFNLDHEDKKSSTNLFAGYFDLRVNGAQRWFQFKGTSEYLPSAPKSSMNYDYPETTKYAHGYLMTLNHEQKLNDTWSAFINTGMSTRSGNKYNSQSSLYFDNNGNFTTNNMSNQQNESSRNIYAQVGIRGNIKKGVVEHNISFAIDRSYATYFNSSKNSGKSGLIGGDLYSGIVFESGFYPLPEAGHAIMSFKELNVGVTLADNIEIGKMQLLLSGSRRQGNYRTSSEDVSNVNFSPSLGITYKPVENLSIYSGYSQSYSRGQYVSDATKYDNAGTILDPVESKQSEIGIKYKNRGILTTLSYFELNEGNYIDEYSSGEKGLNLVQDGENKYKGLEFTINGKIAPKWTATGGLLYLDGHREKTAKGASDGLFVNGVAKWSSVIGLVYSPNEKIGIIGRAVWNDKCYIDSSSASGKTEIPSYVAFDLGVNYKTKINTVPVTLSAMCYNATNKDYWIGRGGSTTFGLSMPRTFMLSAKFDF